MRKKLGSTSTACEGPLPKKMPICNVQGVLHFQTIKISVKKMIFLLFFFFLKQIGGAVLTGILNLCLRAKI